MKACSIEGCNGKHHAKGYCQKHYMRLLKHNDPLYSELNREHNGKCSIEGCNDKFISNGFCSKHYFRFIRHGDSLKGSPFRRTDYGDTCTIDGCENKHKSQSYCQKHYEIWKRNRRRAWKLNSLVNDFTVLNWVECLKKFNNKCAYCGSKDKKIHQEHVVPLSKGGSNTITNIIPACERCNLSKSNTLIEVWYPKQHFYSKQKESKIYKWMGYKVDESNIQKTLF
jgi:5-methylcytosine-specific restriction endonuclease McrA